MPDGTPREGPLSAPDAAVHDPADQAAALDVFTAYTELAATQTDVPTLTRKAYEVMDAHFTEYSSAYYEERDGLWKALTWTEEMTREQIDMIRAGLPLDVPSFAEALTTRRPVYIDGWDPERDQIENTEVFGPVCIYPLVVGGEVRGIFTVGLRVGTQWQPRDLALMRALGRSLTLALERAEQTRQLEAQNLELQARTRALEIFAEHSRTLSAQADPYDLIQRVQELLRGYFPHGVSVYYELDGNMWRVRSQVGEYGDAELQRQHEAGLPYAAATHVVTPYETGEPYYQETYDTATYSAPETTAHVSAIAMLPLRVGGRVRGVFGFARFGEGGWSGLSRGVMEGVVRSLGLAVENAERARQIDTERVALAAFAAFSEAVGTSTDPQELVSRAEAVARSVFADASVAYHELEGGLWKLRAWSSDVDDALVQVLRAGLPEDFPAFREAVVSRAPHFIEDWRPVVTGSESYTTTSVCPLEVGGEVRATFNVARTRTAGWNERDRAIVRALARGFNLALERAHITRTLQERETRLADVNAELRAYASSMSRDIAEPARRINSFLRLLERRLGDALDEKGRHHLLRLRDEAGRLEVVVSNLRHLALLERRELVPERVSLDQLLVQVRSDLEPVSDQRRTRWTVDHLPAVRGDVLLLRQAFTEILAFALERAHCEAVPTVQIGGEARGAELRVWVRDNGPALDPGAAEALFEVHARLVGASGMRERVGLPNVRRIVARHGGRVWAESSPGTGSLLFLTLPLDA